MTIFLTGSTGMLGSEFASRLGISAATIDRELLDVRRVEKLESYILSQRPEWLINCAAHVDAEAAEADPYAAYVTNTLLPELLATACRRTDTRLVHFSSTGCYGSWKSTPYTEDDQPQPTTAHHRSKLAGEGLIRDSGCEALILRTGWLFGGGALHKKNFVWRRIVEAHTQSQVTSDATQFGNPTYVGDVVTQTLRLMNGGLIGLYNCVGRGTASRYEYVERIVAASGLRCSVRPGPAFVRVAPVSYNEMGINYRLGALGLDSMPAWTTSLDEYVTRVRDWPEWHQLTGSRG